MSATEPVILFQGSREVEILWLIRRMWEVSAVCFLPILVWLVQLIWLFVVHVFPIGNGGVFLQLLVWCFIHILIWVSSAIYVFVTWRPDL